MAQHDYVIANGTGAAVRSDINSALAAIVSQNSGATEPATTYAYQFWADTTTATLKLRNSANSAWIELMQLDGTLTMEDGTTALPGLAFRNDLDTGLWRPGANQLAISTNAVERVEFGATEVVFNDGGVDYDFRVEGDTNANLLFVDASTDRVGIGTNSPSSLLHLSVATAASDGTKGVRITNPAGTAAMFECGSSNDSYIGTTSGSDFSIRTNNTSKIYVTNGGNVGIGTTSPTSTLSVGGNAPLAGAIGAVCSAGGIALSLSDNVNSSLHVRTASGGAIIGTDAGGPLRFATNGVATTDERARIDSSGRLLVGTSSARTNINILDQTDLTPSVQFEGQATSNRSTGLSIINYSASSYGASLSLGASKSNTAGTNALVIEGGDLGTINFVGADGTRFLSGATIRAVLDGTTGSGDLPTRLVISTTADGASSPTERLHIAKNGAWGLAGANYGSSGQVLTSNGSGSAPTWQTAGGGKILQVVNATKTDTQSTTSATYVDITGLSATITPASSSSKILVMVSLGHTSNSDGNQTAFNLLRGSTTIIAHSSGSGQTWSYNAWTSSEGGYGPSRNHEGQSITYLDSPATASAITYKVQFRIGAGGTGYINRWALNSDIGGSSSITLMEVAP